MNKEDRIVGLLPENGAEIAYEAWLASISFADRAAVNVVRGTGRVVFRLETDENGAIVGHFVSRKVA